jgi:hypothetical protein
MLGFGSWIYGMLRELVRKLAGLPFAAQGALLKANDFILDFAEGVRSKRAEASSSREGSDFTAEMLDSEEGDGEATPDVAQCAKVGCCFGLMHCVSPPDAAKSSPA